ncbi:MAG TPA: PilZ domain-containing protein [Steroidobacteraceae bacterium]
MYDGKDTIVIFDKLAYEDLLPVRWRPSVQLVDDVTAQHYAERNIRVLQACDALEEHGQLDKSDDESPHSADLRRLDFKLNLLLDLAGQLLAASQPRLRPSSIRLNAMGASFTYDEGLVEGAYGVLELMLRDIVVQPLHLPAQVVSGAPAGQVRVRFLSLGEVVADHIEKLVFRRHRRKIAGARGIRRA